MTAPTDICAWCGHHRWDHEKTITQTHACVWRAACFCVGFAETLPLELDRSSYAIDPRPPAFGRWCDFCRYLGRIKEWRDSEDGTRHAELDMWFCDRVALQDPHDTTGGSVYIRYGAGRREVWGAPVSRVCQAVWMLGSYPDPCLLVATRLAIEANFTEWTEMVTWSPSDVPPPASGVICDAQEVGVG